MLSTNITDTATTAEVVRHTAIVRVSTIVEVAAAGCTADIVAMQITTITTEVQVTLNGHSAYLSTAPMKTASYIFHSSLAHTFCAES